MLPTGFRTFHFVSFLYVFFLFISFSFVSFLFSLFCFRFFAFRFFFSFLFVTFLLVFFSFFFFPFLFVFFRFSVYRYPFTGFWYFKAKWKMHKQYERTVWIIFEISSFWSQCRSFLLRILTRLWYSWHKKALKALNESMDLLVNSKRKGNETRVCLAPLSW